MKVAVDPGHGMSNRQLGVYDPGATHIENGFKYEEAAIALKYCLTLRDVFRANGIDVFMTRDDAEDHAYVGKRAVNAKDAGCDVLISIHLNDYDDDSANGQEILYHNAEGKLFADKLQNALLSITGFKDRGNKQRTDLAVLKFKGIAALIELGFIANDKNREVLLSPQKREQICQKIAATTIGHLKDLAMI